MTKVCIRCKKEKPLYDFHINRSKKDGRQLQCKGCMKNLYKKKYKKTINEGATQRARIILEFIQNKKQLNGCQICENEFRPYCLDFHHEDPSQKDIAVSQMIWRSNIKRVEKEIAKCIIVCKNCHAELHDKQRTSSRKVERRALNS